MLPNKSQWMTIAFTLAALALINNVNVAAPIKRLVNGA